MSGTYGYIFARDAEEEKQQRKVMRGLAVPEQNIFADCLSRENDCHPMLIRMGKKLSPEDLVYVKNLNCLGSSYDEILENWGTLTKKQKADVAVLDMPLLDTRRGKEFMETLVSDIVIEMLAFVAENEHDKHSQRSTEVYLEAKSRGVRCGRPIKPLPENFTYVYERWKANRYREEQENLGAVVNH